MFDRLKKSFLPSRHEKNSTLPDSNHALVGAHPAAHWAAIKGLVFAPGQDQQFTVSGIAAGKHWKLECGSASRDYIEGDELRARATLKIGGDISIFIVNRLLKEALEKRAYLLFTDSLQTTADADLTDEMRWLSMYPEVGWNGLSAVFWGRYAVLAEERAHAVSWITPALASLLTSWPARADVQRPFMLMLLRGKIYLRMQHEPSDLATLDHAVQVLTVACEAAVQQLSADISV